MVMEIRIRGTFITGTTVDDPEEAKQKSLELLKGRLKQASLLETSDLFLFVVDSVEAEKI